MDALSISLLYGAGTVVHLIMGLVVLVLVLARIRPQRPDAYPPLMWWAVLTLVWGVLRPVLTAVVPMLIDYGSVSFTSIHAVLALGSIPVDVAIFVLFVRGLLRLAQPPPGLPHPGAISGPPPMRSAAPSPPPAVPSPR